MTKLSEIYKKLKFVSAHTDLTASQIKIIYPILEEELKLRDVKRVTYLLKRSGIKRVKRIEDFDWKFNPKLPREEIMPFFNSLQWINQARNIVFIGPSGVGKSHLASSLCYQTITQEGLPTTHITCFDLIEKLKKSRNKEHLLNHYCTIKVLCLDELGYVFPNQEQANDIFQIISKRSELLPTIITTNLTPSNWGKIFQAATATAILDRLSFRGSFITCEGKSYRKRK